MKHVRNLAVAGCTVLLLCQCASKNEIRDMNYQIRAVNQKVEEMRGRDVDQMQKRQASSVSRLDQMESDIAQLRSLLEEKAQQESMLRDQSKENVVGLQATVERTQADLDSRIKVLEDRVGQLESNLDRMGEARIRDAEERAREAARRAEEARKRSAAVGGGVDDQVSVRPERRKTKMEPGKTVEPAAPPAPEVAAVVPPPSEPAAPAPAVPAVEAPAEPAPSVPAPTAPGSEQFNKAMGLFRAQQYVDAYNAFEQVLAGNPRGDEAAETLFYMGEALFARGEYDLAILDYQKVISNHASHPRTPTALLKQGMSFEKLTDHETAKIIYKKLIADYPESAEASTAEQQLASLR